jgi:hypothetical protein
MLMYGRFYYVLTAFFLVIQEKKHNYKILPSPGKDGDRCWHSSVQNQTGNHGSILRFWSLLVKRTDCLSFCVIKYSDHFLKSSQQGRLPLGTSRGGLQHVQLLGRPPPIAARMPAEYYQLV